MSHASTPTARALKPPRLLWNLLLAGLLLRLLILGYWSLWLDEGVTWTWATYPTWAETVTAEANHPPLWWLITRAQVALFGASESSLRFPAALLSVIGMGLAWLLGVRLFVPSQAPRRGGFLREADGGRGRVTAVWFAGLVAGSAYLIEYAQEARMYSALFVEALGLALLYLRWLDKGDRASLIGYAVLGALTLHTHYFAVFILGGHALHALWLGWRTRAAGEAIRPWPFLAAAATAFLLFVPWLVYAIRHYERIARIEVEPFGKFVASIWRMGVGPGIAAYGPAEQNGLPPGTGRIVAVTAVAWAIPLGLGVRTLVRRPGVRSLVIACAVLPVVALLAASPWVVLVHERYFTFLAPWILALAALGVANAPRLVKPIVGLGLALLFVAGVVAYYGSSADLEGVGRGAKLDGKQLPATFAPPRVEALAKLQGATPYGRTPWREVHAFVRRHAEPGDLVVLHPGYVHLVWDYYATAAGSPLPDAGEEEPLETIRLPLEPMDAEAFQARYGERLRDRRRVFLVLAPPGTPDRDHYYDLLQRILWGMWLETGPAELSTVPPLPFELGWGIRVGVFTRA